MRRVRRALPAVVVIAALLVSASTLWTSFIGDDAFYANIDGWLAAHHGGLFTAFRIELLQEDLRKGRFHPFFVALNVLQFHLFHQPLPLKLGQVIAVGINVGTVGLVTRELTRSATRGLIAAAVAVLTLQMRFVYDATTSDNLHLQLTTECGLLAVGLLSFSLRKHRWTAYAASVCAFVAAVLFYEVMLPLVIPLIVLAARVPRPPGARAALALPFISVTAAETIAIVAIRRVFPQPAGTIYAPHLEALAYLHAAALQIASTIPFLYEIVDPHGVFHATGTYWPLAVLCAVAVLTALAALMLAGQRDPGRLPETNGLGICLVTGGTFLAGPALIVAASPEFQRIIGVGVPYAPVYVQGFGLAIAASAVPIPQTVSRTAQRLFGAACGAALLVLVASNAIVAAHFGYWKYPRTTIVEGLIRGAASGVPSGALVFLDDSYAVNNASLPGHLLWDSRYFYRMWGGREWQTEPLASEHLAPGRSAYEIRSTANAANHGVLVVEHVRGRGGGRPPALIDAEIYERGARADAAALPSIATAFAAADFTPVSNGSGWEIEAFHPHCGALPDDALIADAPSVARIAYDAGFSTVESDGSRRWRWGGSHAGLAIVNAAEAPVLVELVAGIGTVGAATGTVSLSTPNGRRRVVIDASARPIRIEARVLPRGQAEIGFDADAPNAALPGDPRDLRFRLVDATLADRSGCAASDAGR
jgi:hypothetical protein